MRYLFIDASQNSTFLQIGDKSGFLGKIFDTNRNLAAKISQLCECMLVEKGWCFEELDLLSVCTGPGSLTGLRVAIAFMRTLAMVSSKPVIGIDLFSWSCRSLAMQGIVGNTTIVQPTLIDKAFVVSVELPEELDPGIPKLSDRKEIGGNSVYGIRYGTENVTFHEPSSEVLHEMILSNTDLKMDFEKMLTLLPLYVIPSQAERKLSISN